MADPGVDGLGPIEAGPHLVANLVRFQRALRRMGVVTTASQMETLVAGLDVIDLRRRAEVKAAARSALVSRQEQVEIFDLLFDHFFRRDPARPRTDLDMGQILRRVAAQDRRKALVAKSDESVADGEQPSIERNHLVARVGHTDAERLRRKDFAHLTDDERRVVLELLRRKVWHLPPRRMRRFVADAGGPRIDLRRTLRQSLRRGGEPIELLRRRPKVTPRALVILCDISGSMEAYSRIFLQFLYSLRSATDRLEAFVFATRLTRITRELRHRDVDQALARATGRIVDWGGGTRIGAAFRAFNTRWGRRVLGRGAVVAVLSDAWDRGDPALLDRETRRLAGGAGHFLWLNPLLGGAGFQPIATGIRTVLPHIDRLLPVHDLESLEQLADLFGTL